MGGYEHVAVLRDIKVIDQDLLDALQNLPRGNASSDCIQNTWQIAFRKKQLQLWCLLLLALVFFMMIWVC